MNNGSGALNFDAYIADSQFQTTITRMEQRLMGLSNTAQRETAKMDSTFANLGKLAAGYFTFDALSQLPGQLIRVRGEVQQVEIAFRTMLKDQGKADQLLRENIELAAKTPFEFKDVVQGSKQLLAYGSNANTVVKEVAMLGDVAAGVSAPLGDIVYLYGTLRSQGRAYAQDIRQFAGRGIPIYAELAKVLGVSVDKVNDLVSAGKVGFPQIEQAFKNMTSGGGQFAGLMQEQSKSLTGLLSNLKDAIFQATNEVGKANEGMLADILKGGIEVVKNYQPILDIIKVLVITYGAYRAALLVTAAVQSGMATYAAAKMWWDLAKSVKSASDAQALFNLTTKANPYVLAATALVGLIAAVSLYNKELTASEQAEKALTTARQNADSAASGELAKISLLTASINNENLSREERGKKLKELIAISPDHLKTLTLENIKTSQGTDAINGYVDALKRKLEYQEIEKELTASITRQNDIKSGKDELGYFQKVGIAISSGSASQSMGGPLAAGKASGSYEAGIKRANAERIAEEETIQTKLKARIKTIDDSGTAAAKAGAKTTKAAERTVEWYDKEIKSLKEQQASTATSSASYAQQQKQIENLERAKRRITGEQTSAEKSAAKKAAKDADKAGALGSRAYYEDIAQKADEILKKTDAANSDTIAKQTKIRDAALEQAAIIKRSQEQQVGTLEYYESLITEANTALSKTSETDTAGIGTQQYIITQATEKAEALRKKLAVQSFTEQLDEKRKQYTLYEQWVENVGQAAADSQFAELKKGGASYVDYLNGEITKLQILSSFTPLTKAEGDSLSSLTAERDEATGKKKRIDLFTESLAKAKSEAKSLTDYLAILKQKQAEIGTGNSPLQLQSRAAVAQEQVQAENDRAALLRDFLQNVEGSEQQRTAITQKYSDLRSEIDKQASAGIISDYADRLSVVTDAEKQELQAVEASIASQTKARAELTATIGLEGRKLLQERIRIQQLVVDDLKKKLGVESRLYKEAVVELRTLGRGLQADTINSINTLSNLGGQLGQAFSQAGGIIGEVGGLLQGLASQTDNITKALADGATPLQKAEAGISGIIGLFDLLTSSANERAKAEAAYERDRLASQQQYNLALNEQLGMRSELSGNVFTTDSIGKLKDGFAKLTDARTKYNTSLAALAGGRAKVGQGEGVDWGKVGKGAASGAAIGTIAGPIGAAVGGFVGGLIGFFGGKKKEDQFGSLLATYPGLLEKGKDGWVGVNKALAKSLIDQNQIDENTKQLLNDTLAWSDAIDAAKKQIDGVVSDLAGSLGNNLRDALVGAWKDGGDAAQVFGNEVSKILENMVSQILFQQVFSDQFAKLQEELKSSLATGGNGTEALGAFFAEQKRLTDLFNEQLGAAQKEAEKVGLDIFKKTDKAKGIGSPVVGAIKGVSEETANVLEGQINAIRIGQARMETLTRSQLMHLSNIDMSTASMNAKLDQLSKLDEIYRALKTDSLRPKGL